MIPDSHTAADWLQRLAADRLIELSPRTAIDVERLLRLLRDRDVRDPAEVGHSLASLLAKDPERWRQVLEHFRCSFDMPLMPEPPPFSVRLGQTAQEAPREPVPPPLAPAPPVQRPRAARGPAPLQRFVRNRRWYVWVSLVAVLVIAGIASLPEGIQSAACTAVPQLCPRPAMARTGVERWLKPSRVLPVPAGPIYVVENPRRTPPILVPVTSGPSSPPGPGWLRWLLACASLLLGALAVRWWFVHRDYADDVAEAERRSDAERHRLMAETSTLGVPYHIERCPPLPAGAIDDAATLLGRIARREQGLELDVPPTIERTIDAGGRVVPVFSPSGRREALLILVDIEQGSHPYLDGVEWVLSRWRRLGVPFVRYDFRERPLPLLRHPNGHPITLDELGRRSEGMPLLIFSRMALPQDYQGRLDWLRGLEPWPNRALIDLDPRLPHERRKEARRVLNRIAHAHLPRYPFTREGLLACAAALAGGGEKLRSPQERPLAAASDPAVQQALWQWAAAACCVPHPSWAQLDSLRRELPEISTVLPDVRHLQRLIDWVREKGYGMGEVGVGDCLWLSGDARTVLRAKLRRWDRACWPDADAKRLEHRARSLLIRQLKAADVRDDPFERQKRDMKAAVNEAVLSPGKAEQLLAEFADKAIAPELRGLLQEELQVQELAAPGPGEPGAAAHAGGWSAAVRDAAGAWVGKKGVRLRDLLRFRDMVRLGRWSARQMLAVAAVIVVAAASWVGWWLRARAKPLAQAQAAVIITPASWKVTDTPRPVAEPGHVALAEVAPMQFVRLRGGTFQMGSTPEERERFTRDLPKAQRDVYEDERWHPADVGPFELGAYEVTQKQWREVMGTKPFNCDWDCGDDLPAQNVSWIDAVNFMNALTDRENRGRSAGDKLTRCYDETKWSWDRDCTGYRLPTEVEWEFAARAGSETAYSFGDDPKDLCGYANGADLAAKRKHSEWAVSWCDDGYADLAPVGRFKPNGWGLFDMHGNVWEWVWDRYGPYPDRSPVGYAGPDSGETRVLRGGSFNYVPRRLRSSNRDTLRPTFTSGFWGFRCARASLPGA